MKLKSPLIPLAGFCAALFAPASALAQQYGGGNSQWGPHMMWGGGVFGGFFMIIFWILVIAAIFLGVRWAVKNNKSTSGPDRSGSAMDVLKERYASGEINRETFMNMKKDLEN